MSNFNLANLDGWYSFCRHCILQLRKLFNSRSLYRFFPAAHGRRGDAPLSRVVKERGFSLGFLGLSSSWLGCKDGMDKGSSWELPCFTRSSPPYANATSKSYSPTTRSRIRLPRTGGAGHFQNASVPARAPARGRGALSSWDQRPQPGIGGGWLLLRFVLAQRFSGDRDPAAKRPAHRQALDSGQKPLDA